MVHAPPPEGYVGTQEAAERAGITARVLDYWIRTGAVTIAHSASGSGRLRFMTEAEAERLVEVGRVVRALGDLGVPAPRHAVARWWKALECPEGPVVECIGPLTILLRP